MKLIQSVTSSSCQDITETSARWVSATLARQVAATPGTVGHDYLCRAGQNFRCEIAGNPSSQLDRRSAHALSIPPAALRIRQPSPSTQAIERWVAKSASGRFTLGDQTGYLSGPKLNTALYPVTVIPSVRAIP